MEMAALILWISVLSLVVFGTILALGRLRVPQSQPDIPYGLFPVTILKPVMGIEPGLRDNIESFFRLDYPEFEILFNVASENDPSIPVVRSVMKKYPRVRAELLVGSGAVGANPKINNLMKGYEKARYDWILISDSNTYAEPDFLKKLVGELDSSVGVLTCAIAARGGISWGGWLEKTFLNSFYARWMFVAPLFGKPCVVGKAMMLRRSVAEKFGGLKALGGYLAEDYRAGEVVRELGYRVTVARTPVVQPIGSYPVQQFWKRHLRWGRIRKAHEVGYFLLEPLGYCLPPGLLGAWALHAAWGHSFLLILAAHCAIWGVCDWLLARRLEPETFRKHFVVWMAREALAIPLWLHTLMSNKIDWRGQRARLLRGGKLDLSQTAEPSLT